MEIRKTLEGRGYTVDALSAVDITKASSPPRNNAQVTSPDFAKAFLNANASIKDQYENADVVVVNGEGSLHGAGQTAFTLLFLIHLAKEIFEKPVHAINMSLFPADTGEPDDALDGFYADILRGAKYLAVREPLSYKTAQRLGLNVVQAFDSLPRYLKRLEYERLPTDDGPIVLGGGLAIKPVDLIPVVKAIESVTKSRPVHYVTGAQAYPALDDEEMVAALPELAPTVTVMTALTFDDWVSAIGKASCLISGRFHHTIAALYLNTPVIAFRAGTPKIDGLCAMSGLDAPLSANDEAVTKKVMATVEAALTGHGQGIDGDFCRAMVELGALNFESL